MLSYVISRNLDIANMITIKINRTAMGQFHSSVCECTFSFC